MKKLAYIMDSSECGKLAKSVDKCFPYCYIFSSDYLFPKL